MFGMISAINDRLNQLRQEMDQIFREFAEDGTPFGGPFPALNAWEDDHNFYVEAELPGFRIEDVELHVRGAELTLSGERKPQEKPDVTYHRRERAHGRFHRTLELPVPIEADKVQATLSDGVLTVTLPKAEAARPRKIEVKAR